MKLRGFTHRQSWSTMMLIAVMVVILMLCSLDAEAQCAMCKAAAESNMRGGGTEGRGLNNGILYMLLTPYLLVAGIGYLWYKNKKKAELREANDA